MCRVCFPFSKYTRTSSRVASALSPADLCAQVRQVNTQAALEHMHDVRPGHFYDCDSRGCLPHMLPPCRLLWRMWRTWRQMPGLRI